MKENVVKKNVILEKTFVFSLSIIKVCRILKDNREYVLSDQLLRSGTSIGANVEESAAAQSRKDFISKMTIASKEARETRYWLRLLDRSKIIDYNFSLLMAEINEIIKILTAIVKTTQSTN